MIRSYTNRDRWQNVTVQDVLRTIFSTLGCWYNENVVSLVLELTEPLLVAQAFLFFVAGFETSSSTIGNALYELAQNQDIQDKLRAEIKEHHELYDGKWQYENIKKMPILDAVFKGSLDILYMNLYISYKCS